MDNDYIHIEALDCLPFKEGFSADILQEFIKSQCENVFYFTSDYLVDTESKLAEYDYRSNKWIAGRFVGESIFTFKDKQYKITIKPRFGEAFLFEMLEEIYNIRITKSASEQADSIDWQHYIKRIIAFIWIQKLANANLHGLPKVNVKRQHKGTTIRGRLNVRKTIIPLYNNQELISNYHEKQIDNTVSQIILQAFKILKKEFQVGNINMPDSAQDVLNQIHSFDSDSFTITESIYKNIKYKDIYSNWKPIVDLSWDIIKRKQLSLKQNKKQDGFGFFIDMAEVWEQYIRSVLTKSLSKRRWKIREIKEVAYQNNFFKRLLIPDLVFQRNNEIAVWDAKYKRMTGSPFDVDRGDFFQIHTYIQNYLNKYEVKAGGLIYPISVDNVDWNNYSTSFLMNTEGYKMNFCIDGIELKEEEQINSMKRKKEAFIDRINRLID